jgi:hypothetical protein
VSQGLEALENWAKAYLKRDVDEASQFLIGVPLARWDLPCSVRNAVVSSLEVYCQAVGVPFDAEKNF